MTKYHINDDGNAGKCSAEAGKCPFGSDTPHFGTKKEAQKYYEQTFNNSFEKPKPVKKTKVFRVGTLSAPETYFDDLNNILDAVDELKPDGRQGRKGGIFASPDIKSHSRWVLGSRWNKHEGALDSHEITVDANSVYVYSVESYEQASSFQNMFGSESEKFKEAAEKFWNQGMTLSEFQEWEKENKPDPGDWELIMAPESIMSAKKVSNKIIIESASENRASELNHLLEPNRARKGLIWRKSDLNEDEEQIIQERANISEKMDQQFINDMAAIYKKNAYQSDNTHNPDVRSEIYSAMKRLRKKDGEDMRPLSELSRDEKSEFSSKISKYLRVVEQVIEERKDNDNN